MIDVNLKFLKNGAKLPMRATQGSAGFDLYCAADAGVRVRAGSRELIPTGLAAQIPAGYAGFIFARSGMAHRKGVSLANGVGVIDSDYRGEIQVAVANQSREDYTVNPGDRVAQLVFMPIEDAKFTLVDELSGTKRGVGGFGSTGGD